MKKEILGLYKTNDPLPKQRKLFQRYAKSHADQKLFKIIENFSLSAKELELELTAHLLIPEVYFLNPQKAQKVIYRLANNEDWGIREEAATILKGLNRDYFIKMIPVYRKWIKGGNNYIQRAICVGLFGIRDHFDKACEVIEPILKNSNRYVRINLGPFGLAWLYYKDKQVVSRYINRWLRIKNENVLWNIVMIFSQARGKYEPGMGLKMVENIGQRVQEKCFDLKAQNFVQRGCASVLYNIAKHHKGKVQRFMDRNRRLPWFKEILNYSERYLNRIGVH